MTAPRDRLLVRMRNEPWCVQIVRPSPKLVLTPYLSSHKEMNEVFLGNPNPITASDHVTRNPRSLSEEKVNQTIVR
jgi:hypothetical protein